MSDKYDRYIEEHQFNVATAYYWLEKNLPEVLDGADYETQILEHDVSKYKDDEYLAYDAYFYGERDGDGNEEVKREFEYAWLRHIHRNPHHWQHWVLINDEPGEGIVALDMPHKYIIEMICDWWAFSWKEKKLGEIFSWYAGHKDYMKLSEKTHMIIEDILLRMRLKLDEMGDLND